MTPNDFVFNQVYRGALAIKVREPIAKDVAIDALNEYKKGRFVKPTDLIRKKIAEAKKRNKAPR